MHSALFNFDVIASFVDAQKGGGVRGHSQFGIWVKKILYSLSPQNEVDRKYNIHISD